MSRLFVIPQAVRINSTGTPFANAKANFYLTGTTTRTDTYTNNARTVAHENPVLAGADGQWPAIFLDPAITYRSIITESDNSSIPGGDVDPVHAPFTASEIAVVDAAGNFVGTEIEIVLTDIGDNYGKKTATGTWSANQTFSSANILMADNEIRRALLKDYAVKHNAVSSSSGTVVLDLTTGNSFVTTLTENITTVTLSNPPATGIYGQLVWKIIQDGGGGAHTVTFPASVLWPGGTAPTITVTNDAIDEITLRTIDAGTEWRGSFSQAFA